MPTPAKSPRRLIEALRQWQFRRQGLGRDFAPKELVLVDAQDRAMLDEAWLRSALYFSNYRVEFAFAHELGVDFRDKVADNIRILEVLAPYGYLHIGLGLPRTLERALEFLGIHYQLVSPPTERPKISPDQLDLALPKRHSHVAERFSVLADLSNGKYLDEIIDAAHETRLTYPDLILFLSDRFAPALAGRSFVAHSQDSLEKINAAEIVLYAEAEGLEHWFTTTNSLLVAGGKPEQLAMVRAALQTGSAAVLYDFRQAVADELGELLSSGGVSAVRRHGLLGASLTQSLEPERAALTAIQSQTLLFAPSRFYEALDDFFAQERH